MFTDDAKLQKRLPVIPKIQAHFKTHFALAHEEMHNSLLTIPAAEFNQEKNAKEIQQETAIAHLANSNMTSN